MVWTCEKRGGGGGIEDSIESAGDRKQKTNENVVQGDIKKKGLKEEQAMDQKSWKKLIAGPPITVKEKDCRHK